MPILVNGQLIDDQVIRSEAILIKERLRQEMPGDDELALELRAREWARENVIERILLQQAAMNDANPLDPAAVTAAMDRAESQSLPLAELPEQQERIRAQVELELRTERLLARIAAHVPQPTSKEIAARYEQNKDAFYIPELVHAAHIVKNVDEVTTEAAAEDAIRLIENELKSGGDFEAIANRSSDCPGRGGDLGFFGRGQMVEEFENVVFALRPGETGSVFRTPFGFHIAKVLDRKPSGFRPLLEVREELKNTIWAEAKGKSVEAFIDTLRATADVRKAKSLSLDQRDEARV